MTVDGSLGRPEEEVARRVATVERVEEVAHLGSFPDERSLQIGKSEVAAVDLLDQGVDGVLRMRETLCRHGSGVELEDRMRAASRAVWNSWPAADVDDTRGRHASCHLAG